MKVTEANTPDSRNALRNTQCEPPPLQMQIAIKQALVLIAQLGPRLACGRLVYQASVDGWTPQAFHGGVDDSGPALVVAYTEGGAIAGGYNPEGRLSGKGRGSAVTLAGEVL